MMQSCASRPRGRRSSRGRTHRALTGVGDLLAPVALGEHDHRAPAVWNWSTYESIRPAVVGTEGTTRHPLRGLCRTGVVDRVVAQVLRHGSPASRRSLIFAWGDIAGDHQGAGQGEPGLDRAFSSARIWSIGSEVDLHHVVRLTVAEVVVVDVGEEGPARPRAAR